MYNLIRKIIPICIILLSSLLSLKGQKIWDGGGEDDQWNNPLNWVGDEVPAASDEAHLNNDILSSNYTVMLPAGATTTIVGAVRIAPSSGNVIALELPDNNIGIPGFIASGTKYGLIIEDGGIFRNASGAETGISVNISDSIRINNGGRYVHITAAGHAANVNVLSAAPGTEKGIMEFDSRDLSTTLSLSGRIYGKLLLNAVSAGGTLNYTAAGTKGLTINSDMEIGPGVSFSLNFDDTISIHRDFIQRGGTVNLGNSSRKAVLSVEGDLLQTAGSVITETGSGESVILLSGNNEQKINMQGAVLNNIALVMNGAGGLLQSPLYLPHRLQLIRGTITTSDTSLLTLLPSCSLKADSLTDGSFINGPLKKEGLLAQDFLFPVGAKNKMRWIALKNASGSFSAAYRQGNPNILSPATGEGIEHISALEYWSIIADALSSEAEVELSFYDPNSGGVTSLGDLRAARLVNGSWENAGSKAVTGSPGANGSVVSQMISGFSAGENYFTLASSIAGQNPLPLPDTPFRIQRPIAERYGKKSLLLSLKSTIVQQHLAIEVKAKESIDIDFVIYNNLGIALKKYHYFIAAGQSTLNPSIAGLPAGLYHIVSATSSAQAHVFRFLKR